MNVIVTYNSSFRNFKWCIVNHVIDLCFHNFNNIEQIKWAYNFQEYCQYVWEIFSVFRKHKSRFLREFRRSRYFFLQKKAMLIKEVLWSVLGNTLPKRYDDERVQYFKLKWCSALTLLEKCPNTAIFLVSIFLHSDWKLTMKHHNDFSWCHCGTLIVKFKKRLQHRCFPVKLAKFLITPFLTEHFRWLLLLNTNLGAWLFPLWYFFLIF